MRSQESFELFLIEELKEQHANMRQTESSAIQFIQQALTGEGLIIAGLFTLLSVKIPFQVFIIIANLAFLLLCLFLHIVFKIATTATVTVWRINSQNAFTRLYFGDKYQKGYLYFYPQKEFFYLKSNEWENVTGTMPSLSRFVGYINSINISAFLFSLITIVIYQAINFNVVYLLGNWIFIIIVLTFITVVLIISSLYIPMIYTKILRREEKITRKERIQAYESISKLRHKKHDIDILSNLIMSANT